MKKEVNGSKIIKRIKEQIREKSLNNFLNYEKDSFSNMSTNKKMAMENKNKKSSLKKVEDKTKKDIKKVVGQRSDLKCAKPIKKTTSDNLKKNVKKSVTRNLEKKNKILKNSPNEHCFILNDGKELKSLIELANSLDLMTDDIFYHHVNEIRNDFAQWTEDIFEDRELADLMRNLNNKMSLKLVILKKIKKVKNEK